MTQENCEESCFWLKALRRADAASALFNIKAREAVKKDEDFDGAAGSMCGSCMMLKRNRAALEEGQRKSLVSR